MKRLLTTLLMLLALGFMNALSAQEEYWEYTFRPGDSIWKVAKQYTNTVNNWAELRELNKAHLGPDHEIRPGARIVIPVSMLKLQPAPALVLAVSGAVTLKRSNGDSDQLKPGTKLYSGDRIITKKQQSLRIQFADKSELQVLPNSEVVMDKLSHYKKSGMVDTRIHLKKGSVNTWVEKLRKEGRYEIKTPSAITAVRGTAYRLSVDGTQVSRTEVIEGAVDVSAGESEKNVESGYGIVAEKDKPLPEPVKLLAAPDVSVNYSDDKSWLTINWPVLEGAQSYRYQVATDEKFNYVILDDSTTSNSVRLNQLSPGKYYLHVRAIDEYRLEGHESTDTFEVREARPANNDLYWQILTPIGMVLLFLL